MSETAVDFYAIIEPPQGRLVRRLRVTREIHQALAETFEAQARELLDPARERRPYEPGYRADNEVLYIDPYQLPGYLKELVASPESPEPLTKAEIEEGLVKGLLAAEHGDDPAARMLFQNFDRRQVIEAEGNWLVLHKDVFRRFSETALAVGSHLTAVLSGTRLYFTSEFMVRRYLDLDEYFREATDEEIEEFIAQPSLMVADRQEFAAAADRWTRAKIASIARRRTLEDYSAKEIRKAAQRFDFDLRAEGRGDQMRIVVPADKKELKRLLRLLDDDLLESELTGQKYEVNSKRRWSTG